MSTSILTKLAEYKVVPVIAIESVDAALPLADALIAGGLPVAEITFRTAAAAEVIETLAKKRPELILGAGTVLTIENMQKAAGCGAAFAVAPGFNSDVVAKAQQLGIPFVPGIANPSDIEAALALDCKILKFFPAEALGGIKMLNAISAPYKHTGVRFMPTGGVNMNNLADYLGLDTVLACGGTWIAKQDDMASGQWQEVQNRCVDVMKVVSRLS